MTGRLKGMTLDYKSRKQVISIEVDEDFAEQYDELVDKDIEISIKQYRKRRSMDANAYCWVLIDKLAEATHLTKTEVYRAIIRDIGGVSTTVCIVEAAVDKLCAEWQKNGIGWQAERMPSKIPGCVNVILYYGSSTYDTAQMTRLIDEVVRHCKDLGIPTETPAEIANMMSQWAEYEKRTN